MKLAAHLLLGILLIGLSPLEGLAASLRNDVLFLLPRESGEVAFVDLRSLRASPHYLLLKQRLVPSRFAHFERFVRSLGVQVDTDVEWLAWALVPPGRGESSELFLGFAEGHFSPEKVEDFFKQQKLPVDAYRGLTLFPFGSGAAPDDLLFTFLDSSTAAFGTRASLELLVETRFGTHDNILRNETLLERISEVNGHAPIWAVFDEHYTRLAVRQLVPEAAKFPEFNRVAGRFRSALLRLSLDREATLSFHAWCAQPMDAQSFSLLLQTGLMAQSWQVQKTNPALSAVLSQTEVSTAGDRLALEVAIAEKDLRALLEQNRPLL